MFVFSFFSPLLIQHVEYLSIRIKTLSPDLVRGRQSKPRFPLTLGFACSRFRQPFDDDPGWHAIDRLSGLVSDLSPSPSLPPIVSLFISQPKLQRAT